MSNLGTINKDGDSVIEQMMFDVAEMQRKIDATKQEKNILLEYPREIKQWKLHFMTMYDYSEEDALTSAIEQIAYMISSPEEFKKQPTMFGNSKPKSDKPSVEVATKEREDLTPDESGIFGYKG